MSKHASEIVNRAVALGERRGSAALLLGIIVLSHCSALWCQQGETTLRSWMIVVPPAANVKTFKLAGPRDQVSYRIQAEYPAENVIQPIEWRLKQLGWKPLPEDFLNPGLPSSTVRGWQYYEDKTTKPVSSVRVWEADWQNDKGDIVTYHLEYRCTEKLCASTYDLRDLRVVAIRIPAKLVEQMKSWSRSRSRKE